MALIRLPYGNELLAVDIPEQNLGQVLSPVAMQAAAAPPELIAAALEQPVASPPLRRLVSPGARVAVIIDDISRSTPTHLMLPPLLAELSAAGVKEDDLRIVIALGTHRPMSAAEILAKTGPDIVRRYQVVNTPCGDESQLVYMGTSTNGIPAWVNRAVAEAEVRIGVGMITPHMDAGFSGGAKIILPGVCGQRTVEAFHRRQAKLYGNQLGLPDAPLRRELEQFVGERIGLDFILNAVIDQTGALSSCVAGDFIQAHRQGVEAARKIYGLAVARRWPVVISNAFPADLDLWQSVKGLASGELMTEDGGTLILVTHCREGNDTHPQYAEYIGRDPEQLLQELAEGVAEDPIACALAIPICRIRQRVRVVLVSQGLSGKDAYRMGFSYCPSLESALACALRERQGMAVGVLTHGGTSLPLLPL